MQNFRRNYLFIIKMQKFIDKANIYISYFIANILWFLAFSRFKTRRGLHVWFASIAQKTWDNGVKDKRSPCRLEYPWFGENKLIISTIVIFVLSKCKVSVNKPKVIFNTKIFHRLYDLFHILMKYRSRFLQIDLLTVIPVIQFHHLTN